MDKNRLEAFSDGVIAVIITIMVLDLKIPHGSDFSALLPQAPVFMCYVLSYIHVGLYWNNHHHLFKAVDEINGQVLWANLHLLFWLSLVPFVTGLMGENHFAQTFVFLYGFVMMMSGVAYGILVYILVRHHGRESAIGIALGKDYKGKLSVLLYVLALGLSFLNPAIAIVIYVCVAAMWFIPDRRIEKKIKP
jgi:uncharacterized membrane protein